MGDKSPIKKISVNNASVIAGVSIGKHNLSVLSSYLERNFGDVRIHRKAIPEANKLSPVTFQTATFGMDIVVASIDFTTSRIHSCGEEEGGKRFEAGSNGVHPCCCNAKVTEIITVCTKA